MVHLQIIQNEIHFEVHINLEIEKSLKIGCFSREDFRSTASKPHGVLRSSRSAEFSSYKHPHFVGACFLPLHALFPSGSPAGRAILLGIGTVLSVSWRNFYEKPGTLLRVECRVFFRRGQLAKQESGLREDSGDFSVRLSYTGYRKFTAAQEGFP